MQPEWLTVHEAARQLSSSESTIRRMIRDGQIPVLRVRRSIRVKLPTGQQEPQKRKERRKQYKPKMFNYTKR